MRPGAGLRAKTRCRAATAKRRSAWMCSAASAPTAPTVVSAPATRASMGEYHRPGMPSDGIFITRRSSASASSRRWVSARSRSMSLVSSWCLNLAVALRDMFQARGAQLFGWPIARLPRRHAASGRDSAQLMQETSRWIRLKRAEAGQARSSGLPRTGSCRAVRGPACAETSGLVRPVESQD